MRSRQQFMSRAEFIRRHRAEIDSVIRGGGYHGTISDTDRAAWIDNDEGLYRWERAERRRPIGVASDRGADRRRWGQVY